jgi:hypothetical protein
MKGSDLVRLTRFDNIEDTGWSFGQGSPVDFWYKNVSGRNGFGIEPESTFITSGVFEKLKEYYGSEPKGNNQLEFSDNSSAYVDVKINRDFDPKNGKQLKMNQYNKGMPRTGLLNTEGTFLSNATRDSIDGSIDNLNLPMVNQFTQTNKVIQDKFLTVDVWPNQNFAYSSFKNIGGVYNKIGGEFTRKYMKTPSEIGLSDFGDQYRAYNNRTHSSGLSESSRMNATWNTLNVNTPIYETYTLESAKLRDLTDSLSQVSTEEKSKPSWKNYRASIISYSNWSSNIILDTNAKKESANVKGNNNKLTVSSGFALNGSVSPFSVTNGGTLFQLDLENLNFFNQGSSITETPWWRHNLPSNESGSNYWNDDKTYYSFFGAGVFNEIQDKDFVNNDNFNGEYKRKPSQNNLDSEIDDTGVQSTFISKAPLFVGLGNDLDSYTTSSKFFPAGNGAQVNYYSNEELTKNGISGNQTFIYRNGDFTDSTNPSEVAQTNYYTHR